MWHLYENPEVENFCPIIWETDLYDFADDRASFYSVSAYPNCRFDGEFSFGYSDNLDQHYYPQYHERELVYSPILINAEIERNDATLTMTARIEIMQEIDDSAKNLFFGYTTTTDSVHAAFARALEIQEFSAYQVGDVVEITHDFSVNSQYTNEMIQGIMFIQNPETKVMYQGKNVKIFNELTADFRSNVQEGPGILTVEFDNLSTPEISADSYEWDFDNDGTIDSIVRNPIFSYETEGSYNVSLTVTKGTEVVEVTKENYITVTDGSSISGFLSGTWTAENSPYTIVGEVLISEESELIIEPGTKIICEDGDFVVRGKITALGTNSEPIIFAGAGWNGFKINSKWNSEFDYCRFYNAEDSAIICDNSLLSVTNSLFWGNSGQSSAAAIGLDNCTDFTITGNLISGNSNSSYCGGIGFLNSSGTISNNIIVNNTGGPAGALALKEASTVTLINNTIVNNQGGATAFVHSSDLTCYNSILRGNSSIFMNISSDVIAEYCTLSENNSGTGNLNADPEFVSPTTEQGNGNSYLAADWNLTADSPCLDAGNPDAEYNDEDGTVNDMGSFGWNGLELNCRAELTINFTGEDDLNGAVATLTALSGEVFEYTFANENSVTWSDILTSEYEVKVVRDGVESSSSIEFYVDANLDVEVSLTGSEDDDVSACKLKISNYPNPFNPTTTISFCTELYEQNEPIEIAIYNTRGQIVKSIPVILSPDSSFGKGRGNNASYTITWNGTDNNNNSVASGIYFARISNGKQQAITRMVLLK